MGKAGLRTIDTSSQISVGLQLSLCRELALAFRQLCKAICDRYGDEGEMLIRNLFISDAHYPGDDAASGKDDSVRRVNSTLVKLLACSSMAGESGKVGH